MPPVHPKLVVGARLCAEHQSQRATSKRPAETLHDLGVTWPLRLVCDTAALRTVGQVTTNFGMHPGAWFRVFGS